MTRGRAVGLAVALAALAVGCGSPPPAAPVRSLRAIDLDPRCPLGADPGPAAHVSFAGPPAERRVTPNLRALVLPAPAGLRTLRWILPVEAFDSPAAARLTFAALGAGEATADPAGFRARLADDGVAAAFGLEGDRVWLDLSFVPGSLPAALAALGELRRPTPVPEARFEDLRREAALQTLAAEAAPAAVAERLLARLLEEAGGETDTGGPAREDGGPDDLLRALEVSLPAARSVLVYAGSDEPQAALDRIATAAEEWPVAPGDTRAGSVARRAVAPLGPARVHVVDQPGARQVELLAILPGVARDRPDFPALEMLASLLGGGPGGRLFRDLRERQGLAYEIDALQDDDGTFRVSTRTRPERLAALMQGVEAHVSALATGPLLACEASMLERRMGGELALEADEVAARIEGLQRSLRFPDAPLGLAERLHGYRSWTASRLDAVAARYLSDPPIWILVGDARTFRGALEAALPDRPLLVYDATLARR